MQRLQLNSTIQTVWASPTEFRFGIQEAIVTLDNPPPRIERLIDALRSGVPIERFPQIAAALGVSKNEQAALLDTLAPILETPETSSSPSPTNPRVIFGGDPRLHNPFLDAINQAGFRQSDDTFAEVAVTTSHFVTSLQLARHWTTRGIPHLPVVFSEREIVIGPFVGVSDNPCVFCVELHRVDAEPAWAAIASQCIGRTAATSAPPFTTLASGFVLSILTQWRNTGTGLVSSQLVLTPDPSSGVIPRTQFITNHPRCDCRSYASR